MKLTNGPLLFQNQTVLVKVAVQIIIVKKLALIAITRENIIDKAEDYEGHALDTSEYTYKEPERQDDGD